MKTPSIPTLSAIAMIAGAFPPHAVELLANGSFDNTSAWTVVPPQNGWTCIANGEAFLHPYPSGYVGTVIQQKLAADLSASRKLKFSAVLSKLGGPSGNTICFTLSYRDGSGDHQDLQILCPSNDGIGTATPLTKTLTLPAAAREITGFSVNKTTNGMFSLQSVSLDLVGVAAKPEIVVEQPKGSGLADGKAKRSFGTVKVGKAGGARTFTIRNAGFANLKNLAITKNGANAADFVVTAPGKSTLAPGAATTFKVTFKPKAKGARAAAIHIKSNDADENPFDIKLSGEGS